MEFAPGGYLMIWNKKADGRDRDRTDDLYRVKVTLVVHRIDSPSVFLLHLGSFCMVFGA